MSAKFTFHYKICLSFLAGILSLTLCAGSVFAGACHGVPQCEEQKKGKIHFKALQTRGWAFYCTGDHPYYWNNAIDLGFGNNFDRSPSCFSVIEDPFEESASHPSKADFKITNWCHKSDCAICFESKDVEITIGCSKVPQNLPACEGGYSAPLKDPGCPIKGKTTQYCSHGTAPACMQVWTEQCSDDTEYYCTKVSVEPTYCIKCK